MADDLTPQMSAEDCTRAEQLSRRAKRPPTVVPGYELEQALGEGAFGEVWVAINQNTGVRVAIKFYSHRGGVDWSLLSREVEKLRFLRADRYVVQLLEVGWDATPPYYVMEYMERGSLEEHLADGPLTVTAALDLIRSVARGLMHAHAKGILHCDLKPANILLDQDGNPRLADFGQARLTHEQNPALGTLFYMAPEQADLRAVPDVRWDVYALGALLYRMLTGQPPYRTEDAAKLIQEAPDLQERLRRYRHWITVAPKPSAHRQVPHVDRRLGDILDRCLALSPQKRYANPQAVLEAIDARALSRARRPLLILGTVMPALFLLVIALFAVRSLDIMVGDAGGALTRRAQLSDRFAAQFAASAVARQVTQRWNILEEEAEKGEFHHLIVRAEGKGPDEPERVSLQDWLDHRQKQYERTTTAKAWFLMDAQGKLLAVSPLGESRSSLGRDLSARSYFHGQGQDYTDEEMKTRQVKPIDRPTQSVPFVSATGEKVRMVVFSVPVRNGEGKTLGVLGMGVRLGDFKELLPAGANGSEEVPGARCAVLVETRKDRDGQRGVILQHPWLSQSNPSAGPFKNHVRLPDDLVGKLQALRQTHGEDTQGDADLLDSYQDPVEVLNEDYRGPWLAAAAPVVIEPRKDSEPALYTGWVVIVQERSQEAVKPVRDMEAKLRRQGLLTAGILLGILCVIWLFVLLLLDDSPRSRLSALLRSRVGFMTGMGKTAGSQLESALPPRKSSVRESGGNTVTERATLARPQETARKRGPGS